MEMSRKENRREDRGERMVRCKNRFYFPYRNNKYILYYITGLFNLFLHQLLFFSCEDKCCNFY
nr:MAG TPA: hypothetical protein [Caudoviricetes sp.]